MAHRRLFLADQLLMRGLLMASETKIIVILIILALNEQKFNSIHWEKNERQDRLEHLKVVPHSACLLEQTI